MEESEERARISWALRIEPGDTYVAHLIAEEGPEAALQRVIRSSGRDLGHYFQRLLGGDQPTPQHVAQWKEALGGVDPTASLERQRALDIRILTPDSDLWPRGLIDLGPYQPSTLWYQGRLEMLGSVGLWLGVVGSRQATPHGIEATREIVGQASADSHGVVSGGALGVDGAAHHAAEKHRMPQIAVLAGGLDQLYPGAHRDLLQRISTSGLLVSEAPCTLRNEAHRFLHRNRIIAALSDAVVVVEAAWRSGAVNTGRHAGSLGRGLGVVPGRWGDEQSAGCFRLVRDAGATILTEPADVHMLFSAVREAEPKMPRKDS